MLYVPLEALQAAQIHHFPAGSALPGPDPRSWTATVALEGCYIVTNFVTCAVLVTAYIELPYRTFTHTIDTSCAHSLHYTIHGSCFQTIRTLTHIPDAVLLSLGSSTPYHSKLPEASPARCLSFIHSLIHAERAHLCRLMAVHNIHSASGIEASTGTAMLSPIAHWAA